MGLMNKLRDKTHIILIILIVAFLATIVFEWGMNYLGLRGGEAPVLGSVNGKEINLQEYEAQVQAATEQQRQQTGEDLDETMVQMIRDQVWDQMVTQMLAQQTIEKLGIKVTNQEILNWVYNSPQTLPDVVKRNFVDSTGQFNMQIYQQALATKTPEVTKFWAQVEEYLKQTLLSQKLQSVITASVRVSEADVLQKYKDDNISASFTYLPFDVSTIPDAQIQINDNDLKAYYDSHKEDYKSQENAKLKYVLFSDAPTIDDSISTEKQLRALTKEFKKYPASGDSSLISFVNTNSLTKFNDNFVKPSEIPAEVASFLFSAKKDSVSDVIKSADGYHMVRLIDSKDGEDLFVNASHILISFGSDTNAAKVKAEQIYARAKNGEDFSKLAADNSDDASNKNKGGSLGYFTKGAMVKPFEDAAMNANVGEIVGPVKTTFGYHIIKVNDKQKKLFKFADLKKPVKTSSRTKDAVRKRAEDFAYISKKGNFDEEAAKLNMKAVEVPPITKESFIPGAGQNKTVSKFAFNEKKGSVSDPIKIQTGYAVYLIVDRQPAGYSNFDDIKATTITQQVRLEKKLDILKQQAMDMKGKITNNDLMSLKNINPQLNIQTADSVTVSKPVPQIGADFDFYSALFKLQNGQISEPIRTQKGYYLVQVKNITPFDPEKFKTQADAIRTGLIQNRKQTILQEWLADLKEKAVIVDNRDKFFRQ